MTREEALEAQATLRTLNEWMMEQYNMKRDRLSDKWSGTPCEFKGCVAWEEYKEE